MNIQEGVSYSSHNNSEENIQIVYNSEKGSKDISLNDDESYDPFNNGEKVIDERTFKDKR